MPDILVVGNINADRVLRLHEPLRTDGKLLADDLGLRLGGAAANAASALVAAGDRVRLVGFVGSDPTGLEVRGLLRQWDWDATGVLPLDGPSSSCLVLIGPDGERAVIGLGGHAVPGEWPALPLDGVDAVYLASRWPLPAAEISRLAASGIPVVAQIESAAVVPAPAVVVAPRERFRGAAAGDPWSAVRAGGLAAQWLVVTRGAQGAMATDGRLRLDIPAEPAEVVDTTGAGDAFAAGLVHGTARGWPMDARLALAARWGAIAVGHFGSTFPAVPGNPPGLPETTLVRHGSYADTTPD